MRSVSAGKLRSRAVAAVVGASALLIGAGVGASALSTGTLTARRDGAIVTSGSASVFRGYSGVAGGNIHSADFTVRDRRADGKASYGELVGLHQQNVWRGYPGGKWLLVPTTVSDGSTQTSRTEGTISTGVMIRASADNTGVWTTTARVCLDVHFAPDSCASKTF